MNDPQAATPPESKRGEAQRGVAGPREPAYIVGVALQQEPDAWSLEASLDELEALAETAGLAVLGRSAQRLGRPHPATLIGSGKVEEVKLAARDLGAEVVLFDRELSPGQQRNLEKAIELKVIDRTALILDVFAQHARTREGMLQVELAQYEYRLPRLTRMWTHLARQAGGRAGGARGGVGLRGPGETQLEIDRREIGRRISFLKDQIEVLRRQRGQSRLQRRRAGLPVVALVGYTNAGKSTLLNRLTGAEAYAADQLFATLDPTTRRLRLPSGRAVLLTDTVGFIQKLPTQLIAAFRATLEEVTEADLLVHVVDLTHPDVLRQVETVESVLVELGMVDPPMVVAANKTDRVPLAWLAASETPASSDAAAAAVAVPGGVAEPGGAPESDDAEPGPAPESGDLDAAIDAANPLVDLRDRYYRDLVPISARTGAGLEALSAAIEATLEARLVAVTLHVPYSEGAVLDLVHSHGIVERSREDPTGTWIEARLPRHLLGGVEAFRVEGAAG